MAGQNRPSRHHLTKNLERDGACLIAAALSEEQMSALADQLPQIARPGLRLSKITGLAAWLDTFVVPLVVEIVGHAEWKPVRAILFDKTASTNWGLGWHQDRTIVVKARAEAAGFAHWSIKDGLSMSSRRWRSWQA